MVWTPEPTYAKPEISVRATTLYYQIAAPILLPFLDRRLLNHYRCREGKCFFQRNREHPPTGTEFDQLVSFEAVAQKNGRTEQYLYAQTAEEIVACAKVQTVEFHGWGSRAGQVETPDRLVIDLDPGEGVGFAKVKEAALQLRLSFEALGLTSFALLTGGKGIHIVAPLLPEADWDAVRAFAKAFCTALAEADPQRFTIALPKKQRRGRIFLDFLRNQRTATAIMPYSARAQAGMPVATPVTWGELETIDRPDPFSIADVEMLLKGRRAGRSRIGEERRSGCRKSASKPIRDSGVACYGFPPMAGYRQSNPDRAKAALAAVVVHAAIGAAFLTGLVTNVSRQPSEVMRTFDVTLPPPPPPPVVEVKEESAPERDPGEAGKKAEPTPVVAPEPKIVVPAKPPVVAAPVAGQGAAPSAGAAAAGTGTGAGGSGSGRGGGGSGGEGFTPAQRISKIPNREYRRFVAASGMRTGSVAIMVKVNTDGRPSNCRIVRSSGNPGADGLMCQLTVQYVRFRPARDPQGRPVAQDITWVPDWAPN
jgi:protein TonB